MSEQDIRSTDHDEIRRYLFAEMSGDERDGFEARLIDDERLYAETADLENDLIDLFAAGRSRGDDLERFEASIDKFPDRRERIANARAFRTAMAEGADDARNISPSRSGVWQRIGGIFAIRTPAFGAAMSVVLVASVILAAFFYVEYRRTSSELARLRNGANASQRETELREQITMARQNADELQRQLDEREQQGAEFVSSLDAEQRRVEQLEAELRKISDKPVPDKGQRPAAQISSLVLDGNSPDRDGRDVSTARLGDETRKLAINIELPANTPSGERLSVELNGKPLISGALAHAADDGKPTLNVVITRDKLAEGANRLTVSDQAGKRLTEYEFRVDKP